MSHFTLAYTEGRTCVRTYVRSDISDVITLPKFFACMHLLFSLTHGASLRARSSAITSAYVYNVRLKIILCMLYIPEHSSIYRRARTSTWLNQKGYITQAYVYNVGLKIISCMLYIPEHSSTYRYARTST